MDSLAQQQDEVLARTLAWAYNARMDAKPLKAAAKSGAAQPKAGIAGQPDPLTGPGAAKGGASQAQAGRAVRLHGLEFPGCKPVRMTREDIASFEGRLEFWDADAATAWICEPTSPHHERPSRRLARLVERIALVRGSPFECYGHMDLLLRDRQGHARRIMQADESLYLHPGKARLPGISAMVNAALARDSEANFGVRISELRQGRTPRCRPFNS